MHDHIVSSISRRISSTDIAAHSDIEQYLVVSHRSSSTWNLSLHHRSTVNTPDKSSLSRLSTWLIPCKVKPDGPTIHIVYVGLDDPMFLMIFTVELSPM